jgi:hypothetical protein
MPKPDQASPHLDRLKLMLKAWGLDTPLATALVIALAEGGRSLKALEEQQQPVIAAGMAARQGSVQRRLQGLGRGVWSVNGRIERRRRARNEASNQTPSLRYDPDFSAPFGLRSDFRVLLFLRSWPRPSFFASADRVAA